MPELPEAENIGRALKRTICGETITKVEVFTPVMRTSLLPLAEADLPGHRIVDVRRRARYLVAEISPCKYRCNKSGTSVQNGFISLGTIPNACLSLSLFSSCIF